MSNVTKAHPHGDIQDGHREIPLLITQVEAGEYDAVICDIPDATWCKGLRGPLDVWGRPNVGGREQRRIRESNAFLAAAVCLCRAMDLVHRCRILCGASVGKGGGASIWDTDIVQELCQQREPCKVAQCCLGVPGAPQVSLTSSTAAVPNMRTPCKVRHHLAEANKERFAGRSDVLSSIIPLVSLRGFLQCRGGRKETVVSPRTLEAARCGTKVKAPEIGAH